MSASTSNDALLLFSNAISSSPNSSHQRKTLIQLKNQFDSNPALLPILYPSLLSLISTQSNHPSIKKWVSSIIELAICRPNLNLSSDQKLQIIIQSTETIHKILHSQDLEINSDLIESKKFAIQAATTSYPIIFKLINTKSTSDHTRTWSFVQQTKSIILSIFRSNSQTISLGLKISSIKFIQRLIQVGTKGGSADPRKRSDDPSISICSTHGNSLIKPKEIEQESTLLLEELIRLLYQTNSPEIASAIIITTGTLVRHRPTLSTTIINTLTSYIPPSSPIAHNNKPSLQIKGVEKTLRITLSHLERHSPSPQIREALVNQLKRFEELNEKEKDRKRRRKEEDASAKKRAKNGSPIIAPVVPQQTNSVEDHHERNQSQLQGFDVTSLGLELVVELVIANLLALDDQTLHEAMARFRYTPPTPNNIPDQSIHPTTLPIPSIVSDPITRPPQVPIHISPPTTRTSTPIPMGSPVRPKMEPMISSSDLDPEEEIIIPILEEEEEEIEEEKEGIITKWETESPLFLNEQNRRLLLKITLDRIAMNEDEVGHEGVWSTLLARLVTRGMDGGGGEGGEEVEERREDVRASLFGFVVADFPKRMHFARVWLMEEWLATRKHQGDEYPQSIGFTSDTTRIGMNAYDRWLGHILDHILTLSHTTNSQGERNTRHLLSQFLLDLPNLPETELNRLVNLCEESEMLTIGFTSLREITSLRPTLRLKTLDLLLGLTTHKSRQTRNAAIVSVKSWVGSTGREWKVLGERVVSFAIQLVQRLEEDEDDVEEEEVGNLGDEDEGMEDGEVNGNDHGIRFAVVENAVLKSGLGKAKDEETVVRHLELLLALSVKNPDLLDHLFRVYPNVSPHIQDCIQQLITPLIRSLGSKHPKIVSLIENCQTGSESLVLRILNISTEKGGKPPQVIIEAIKNLANKSVNFSPKFIIPLIGEFNKEEILFNLPKILGLLNGSLQEKLEVKSVFESIIQLPPNNFGSVSTNVPRINRGNEVLLTPVELLVKLHQTDDSANSTGGKISIKQAIEAIGLCFSMTEIFKPEVLAAFMQQVVDEMTLPTLFLRTVIQAVQTYKSLQPFVSTTLLSRLIIKKIWTISQLWEGFMRCSKIIAPHSFGALLQLPREQLKELVGKQHVLKAPLRDYVVKKAGNNKSRVMGLLEILSDTPNTSLPTTPNTIGNLESGGISLEGGTSHCELELQDVKGDEKAGDDTVGDEKVVEDKVGEDKVGEEKVAEAKVAEEKVAEEKVAEEKVAEEIVGEEIVANGKDGNKKVEEEKVEEESEGKAEGSRIEKGKENEVEKVEELNDQLVNETLQIETQIETEVGIESKIEKERETDLKSDSDIIINQLDPKKLILADVG